MEKKKREIEDQYFGVLQNRIKTLDYRMVDVIICDYMKWDYLTYLKQPSWFIDLLLIKMRLDLASRTYGKRKS